MSLRTLNQNKIKGAIAALLLLIAMPGLAQKKISRARALADMDYFQEVVAKVHYNPYLRISRNEYDKQAAALKQEMRDSVSLKDLTLLLYKMSALLQDAHTAPALGQPVLKNEYKEETFFPCPVLLRQGTLYLPKAALQWGVVPGSTLLSINGRSAGTLAQQFLSYTGGLPAYKQEYAQRLFAHFLFLSGEKAPFTVNYKTPDGTEGQVTIERGVRYRAALALGLPHLDKAYDFKVIDNKLGYLNFLSMSGKWEDFGRYADSCFTILNTRKIPALAIDLRQNSGGDSMLADVLLSYLTKKKYNLMGRRYWKVSADYKEYLQQNGDGGNEYLKQQDGTIWTRGDCTAHDNNFVSGNMYKGKIYFITGPFTFSSANMLADGVKQYKLGTLIGEPTGEEVNDFGEVYSFTLPNSGIKMNVSTSYDIGAACNEKANGPVQPDITISPTPESILGERDPVLETILKMVK